MRTILLDMDEVLVDFRTGACLAHGWDPVQVAMKTKELQCWDMHTVMGISQVDLWKPIHAAGSSFWENLQPLPWIRDLISLVEQHSDEWLIVTSPSRCETSYIGKLRWLNKFFGTTYFAHWIPTFHKYLLANSRTVLIDDREETVHKFRDHGGSGIIFPSIGNQLRDERDPVKYVERFLKTLRR